MLRRLGEGGLLWRRDRARLWLPVTVDRRPGPPDTEAVWRDLRGPLLSFIARRVSDRDSAEDILQEVLLPIHRHAGELIDGSAVGGWIHAIARNAIIDHSRRAVSAGSGRSAPGWSWNDPCRPDPNRARPKHAPS